MTDDGDAEYTEDERKAIRWGSALARVGQSDLAKLGHQSSRRGRQRAVALIFGHASMVGRGRGYIYVDKLRRILRDLGVYDQANFTQDMKKDSTDPVRGRGLDGLWEEHTYNGGRGSGRGVSGYWVLTEKGCKLAADYAAILDRGAAQVQASVKRSFVIKAKAISCPFCREKVTEDDRAICSSACGSEAHASCLTEFGRPCPYCNDNGDETEPNDCAHCGGTRTERKVTCALSRTTVQCRGSYKRAPIAKAAHNG